MRDDLLGAVRSLRSNRTIAALIVLTLGTSLAWDLSENPRAFLFGIAATDPRAAWRAASVDPVAALRAE